MRIPEIQQELHQLAREHGIERLSDLADELSRRAPVRRAPATSVKMTAVVRRRIKDYAQAFPNMPLAEIAKHVGVNPGRVSETLRGRRE